jgi:hypothetical protein
MERLVLILFQSLLLFLLARTRFVHHRSMSAATRWTVVARRLEPGQNLGHTAVGDGQLLGDRVHLGAGLVKLDDPVPCAQL